MAKMGRQHMDDLEIEYKRFFDLSPDLLFIAGFDGYFRKVNPSVCKLLGYDETELYGRHINDFIHPEDRELTSRLRSDLLNNHTIFNFENRYLTKSGEVVWLSWTSYPVMDEQLVFAVAKNVSRRKEVEAEFSRMLGDLTSTNHELKQISYATSHDIRTPVNNLLAVFSMLDAENENAIHKPELMDMLRAATEQLKSTLDDYVDQLKVVFDGGEVRSESNVAKVVHEVMNNLNHLIDMHGVVLNLKLEPGIILNCNALYLKSVVLNVVSNAIKYRDLGRKPEVSVSLFFTPDELVLDISDNGLGFDTALLTGFGKSPFSGQVADDSKGVGLQLVYYYTQRMGGQLHVKSEMGVGSSFSIHFPLRLCKVLNE
jgi:PAS domain S-box-containing protein